MCAIFPRPYSSPRSYLHTTVSLTNNTRTRGTNHGNQVIGSAIAVKSDFISGLPRKLVNLQQNIEKTLLKQSNTVGSKLDGMSDAMAAFEAETAKSADAMKAAIADLKQKTDAKVAVLNTNVANDVAVKTKAPIAAVEAKVSCLAAAPRSAS